MALDPLLDPPCAVEGPKRRLVDAPCSTPSERSEAVESGDMASTLPAQNCSSSSIGEAPSVSADDPPGGSERAIELSANAVERAELERRLQDLNAH